MKNILIYRNVLLPPSETFVTSQTAAMTRYTPYFAGYYKAQNSLELQHNRVIIENDKVFYRTIPSEIVQKTLGYYPNLFKHLPKVDPELIHAHFGPDGVSALPISKKLNIPLITTFHGYDATTNDEHLLKASFNVRRYVRNKQKLQERGTKFIAVSNFIKEKLIEQGYPEDKVTTHYVGIDVKKCTPDLSVTREPIILFVGRLVKNKGCDLLIKALTSIKEDVEAKLVVIGDGPERASLEEMAKKSLKDALFLGRQPHSQVLEWMNKSLLFSVPSVTIESGASEGFGMVFAEANGMGLPVVSFDTGGISEAVEHEKTGFLAPEKNWKQLAHYIRLLYMDENLRRSFSEEGIKRVRKNFDVEKQTEKLEEIYDEVLIRHK